MADLAPNNNSPQSSKTMMTVLIMLAVFGGLFGLLAYLSKMAGVNPAGPTPAPNQGPKIDLAAIRKDWPQFEALASPPLGKAKTPFTLYEFGDFQCPLCGKSRTTFEAMVKQSPDKVNLRFIHRPFPTTASGAPMHEYAMAAAQASEAAARQGKFWQMYDSLYSHQDDLEPGFYDDYAGDIGLDKAKFAKDKNAPDIEKKVENSKELCDQDKIVSTPTILVRNNATGDMTVANSKAQIDALAASPPWLAAAPTPSKKP